MSLCIVQSPLPKPQIVWSSNHPKWLQTPRIHLLPRRLVCRRTNRTQMMGARLFWREELSELSRLRCTRLFCWTMITRLWSLWCWCSKSFLTKTDRQRHKSCWKFIWMARAYAGSTPKISPPPRSTKSLSLPLKMAIHCSVWVNRCNKSRTGCHFWLNLTKIWQKYQKCKRFRIKVTLSKTDKRKNSWLPKN